MLNNSERSMPAAHNHCALSCCLSAPQLPVRTIAMADWDVLFSAVTARLRHAAQDQHDGQLQDTVLDCVQALDQLQAAALPRLQIEASRTAPPR
jgi:hypothetical protein